MHAFALVQRPSRIVRLLLLFSVSALIIFSPFGSNAQSLRSDALTIEGLLDNPSEVVVILPNATDWQLTFEKKLSGISNATITLSKIGRYTLSNKKPSESGNLIITHGLSFDTLASVQTLIVDNFPNRVAWTIRGPITEVPHSGTITLQSSSSDISIQKGLLTPKTIKTSSNSIEISDSSFYSLPGPQTITIQSSPSKSYAIPRQYKLIVEKRKNEVSAQLQSRAEIKTIVKADSFP